MSADSSLGTYLRRRRARSGLSVEAVSAGSRIVPRLVDPLEADRQDLLPAPDMAGSAERVLAVRAIEATWVRVQPDGAEPSEETLSPGSVCERHSAGRFHVTLGDAGAVELELDGQPLPALGERGRVVRNVTVPGEAQP
jgi:hypothetical protein